MVLDLLRVLPGRKPARFSVVSVVGEAELGANKENLAVQHKDSAIIPHPSVNDGHADVADYVIRLISTKQVGKGFPRVFRRVQFQEVVFAAISRQLELGSDAVSGTPPFGYRYRRLDASQVTFEVQRPLVESAGGETCHSHRERIPLHVGLVALSRPVRLQTVTHESHCVKIVLTERWPGRLAYFFIVQARGGVGRRAGR